MMEDTLSGLDITRYRIAEPARGKRTLCERCREGRFPRRLTNAARWVCEDVHACHRRMMAGKLRLVAGGVQD